VLATVEDGSGSRQTSRPCPEKLSGVEGDDGRAKEDAAGKFSTPVALGGKPIVVVRPALLPETIALVPRGASVDPGLADALPGSDPAGCTTVDEATGDRVADA
jgi:hypothetical protein